MDDFYKVLESTGLTEGQIDRIRKCFAEQELLISHLPHLTNEDLKDYGIVGGLRISILAVLGKI